MRLSGYTAVCAAGTLLAAIALADSKLIPAPSPEEVAAEKAPLPINELRTFTEVFAKIKDDYVEPVDDKTLLENAIRGMLSGLDPHSSYLDMDAYHDLQEGTSGEFGGLGIEVGVENGFIKVISPIDDTPAQRAGVKPGDLIVRIDDTPIKDITLNEAIDRMRGKVGSPITLTIVREGQQKPLKIVVVRAIIKVQSVKSNTLEPHFGYLRISHFQSHTGDDTMLALSKLKTDNNNELKGLILDLRNNPGGVLGAAVAVADAFLDSGLIVSTKGRAEDSAQEYLAKPGDLIKGAPLIVLVNGGSASASEIVSGALQDRGRAVIMGSKTFGKGSVQTILPMNNNAALKLTTARYYTPSGRSIQAEGVKPDIVLEQVKLSAVEREELNDLKEANLSGHLTNGNKDKDKGNKPQISETIPPPAVDANGEKLTAKDYELHEALNLLKGLVLLKEHAKT